MKICISDMSFLFQSFDTAFIGCVVRFVKIVQAKIKCQQVQDIPNETTISPQILSSSLVMFVDKSVLIIKAIIFSSKYAPQLSFSMRDILIWS